MISLFPLVGDFLKNNGGVAAVVVAIIAAVTVFFEFQSNRREQHNFSVENRRLSEVNLKVEHKLHVVAPELDARESEHFIQPLTPDQRDEIDAHNRATLAKTEQCFAVLQIPYENIGDGPIDLLATLVSSRELRGDRAKGLGTRSRDVEWDDYRKYPWNIQASDQIFSGISTTKHIVNAVDHFVRLAANEHGALRRMDAINNPIELYDRGHVTLMYRAFFVARGYPLGEILAQLGGGPPDPLRNVKKELLQFQSLAQPTYLRWRSLQQAMINVNRFVFRLALYNPDHPEDSEDLLGVIADPDAWRVFLLHHWEFIDDLDAAPEALRSVGRGRTRLPAPENRIANVTKYVKKNFYENLVLTEGWADSADPAHQTFIDACTYCRTHLAHLVTAWKRMRVIIALCQSYQADATQARRKEYPDESYPALIHNDEYYLRQIKNLSAVIANAPETYTFLQSIDDPNGVKAKDDVRSHFLSRYPLGGLGHTVIESYSVPWRGLQQEGYLLSRPFPKGAPVLWPVRRFFIGLRRSLPWSIRRAFQPRLPSRRSIPLDPRVLEPFVMRTHFFLVRVSLDASDPDTNVTQG